MDNVFDTILTPGLKLSGETYYLIKPYTIYEFLNQDNLEIEIPSYQRPYSWESKHVIALLNDVENIDNKKTSWFLGPILTAELSAQGNMSQLLDGQQRITTIHIILREAYFFHLQYEDAELAVSCKKEFEDFTSIQEQIKRCLISYKDRGKSRTKFSTENTAKDFFSEYLISITNIAKFKDYEDNYKDLEAKSDFLNSQGSRTAKTIINSVNEVRKYFKNFKTANYADDLNRLNSFISSLLFNLWLIKIPVVKSEYSTKIFESINNRGKGLSLLDKLRFKTLTKFNPDQDSEKILEINNSWKNIYQLLDKAIDRKDSKSSILKSEDDFFNVFFNSIEGDDKTKDEDRLAMFENKYLESEQKISQFLSEVINVLNFLLIIDKPDSNDLVDSIDHLVVGNKNDLRSKTISLLRLTRNMIQMSSNSRYLIFNLAIHLGEVYKTQFFSYTIGIWHINKLVFYDEILLNEKSNVIRTRYLKLIENKIVLQDFKSMFNYPISAENENLKRQPIREVCPIEFIINSNSTSAKYSILFTTFLMNHTNLNWGNSIAYSEAELEHIRPVRWKSYNPEIECTKENLLSYFEDLIKLEEFKDFFSTNVLATLKDKFAALSYFDLTQEPAPKESIIEFIGNKVILAKADNKKLQNFNFKEKVDHFRKKTNQRQLIVLPSIGDECLGILNYESHFLIKEILERSLNFTKMLFINFDKSLDEISEI